MEEDSAKASQKKRAINFVVALGVPVVGGIIINVLFGEHSHIKSVWAYLEIVAMVYVVFFLLLALLFRLPAKECATMAACPASILAIPFLIPLALALFVLLLVIALVAFLIMEITGTKEWGTGALSDMFTWKWWKSKGWKTPSHNSQPER